jgi:hypothetical protein
MSYPCMLIYYKWKHDQDTCFCTYQTMIIKKKRKDFSSVIENKKKTCSWHEKIIQLDKIIE